MFPRYKKDPSAILDYVFDFASLSNGRGKEDYLQVGESLSPLPGDVTVYTDLNSVSVDSFELADNNTSVLVWLSGGLAGDSVNITCKFKTNMNRTDERSLNLVIEES